MIDRMPAAKPTTPAPRIDSRLWSMVLQAGAIDASELAGAIEEQARSGDLDFRTRLLIRDSLNALSRHWGRDRLSAWLTASSSGDTLRRIGNEAFEAPGFTTLSDRIMDTVKPETVLQFLRELGESFPQPAGFTIGGSIALIVGGDLSRRTDDIDVVDEVPDVIRSQHELVAGLSRRYGLRLTHFQSHYLPEGWRERVHSLGTFRRLDVFVVDRYDVFLSKLFSAREKDRDDLRALAVRLEKATLEHRLRQTAAALLGEEVLRQNAVRNWYILYGEDLPGVIS